MSSNQFLIDAASRHAVFLQRYSAGLEKQAAKDLSNAFSSIYMLLGQNEVANMSAGLFGSLQLDIAANYRQSLNDIGAQLFEDLEALTFSEAEFTVEMLEQGTRAQVLSPAPQQLQLALNLTAMQLDEPISINSAVKKFGDAKVYQVNQLIRDAYVEGLTSQQTISKVKSIIPLQTRQIASLVRTATNTASSTARMQTMMENSDIFEGYEWVSTLDSRTSHICMSRDGKIYPFKADSPRPPAHWACRSTIIPKVKKQYDLLSNVSGVRPSVGATGAQEQSGNTTYGGWLRKQPASFQDEALGKTRAKLFREGGLKIDQFTDPTGRTYTLDELRGLNPLAFERANI